MRVYRCGLHLILALGLLASTAVMAQAQNFSQLSCPLLAELRMGLLVRFGYCPPDRYYRQLYKEFIPRCNSGLAEFQVENKILNGSAKDAMTGGKIERADQENLRNVLNQLRRKRCRF